VTVCPLEIICSPWKPSLFASRGPSRLVEASAPAARRERFQPFSRGALRHASLLLRRCRLKQRAQTVARLFPSPSPSLTSGVQLRSECSSSLLAAGGNTAHCNRYCHWLWRWLDLELRKRLSHRRKFPPFLCTSVYTSAPTWCSLLSPRRRLCHSTTKGRPLSSPRRCLFLCTGENCSLPSPRRSLCLCTGENCPPPSSRRCLRRATLPLPPPPPLLTPYASTKAPVPERPVPYGYSYRLTVQEHLFARTFGGKASFHCTGTLFWEGAKKSD
jgi:hypothetical protein